MSNEVFPVFWDSKQKFVNNARLKTKNNEETTICSVSNRDKDVAYKVKEPKQAQTPL